MSRVRLKDLAATFGPALAAEAKRWLDKKWRQRQTRSRRQSRRREARKRTPPRPRKGPRGKRKD